MNTVGLNTIERANREARKIVSAQNILRDHGDVLVQALNELNTPEAAEARKQISAFKFAFKV